MSKICYDRDHSLTGPLQGGLPGASYRVCELWSRPMSERRVEAERLEEVPSERDHAFQFPLCSKSQSRQRESSGDAAGCCCMRAEPIVS